MDPIWVLAAGVLAGGIVQGALGFGFGLTALSIGALVLPVVDIVPSVSVLGLVLLSVLLFALRHHLKPRDAGPLIGGALVGVPFGVLLLRDADPAVLFVLLGAALLLGTALQLRSPRFEAPRSVGLGAGLAGGVLGAAVGVSGPPAVLYLAAKSWSPGRRTAALQVYLFAVVVAQLVGYVVAGLLEPAGLALALKMAAPAGLGLAIGLLVFRRLPELWFRRAVQAALLGLGVLFLVRGLT